MKKFFVCMLFLTVAFVLVGCGGKQKMVENETSTVETAKSKVKLAQPSFGMTLETFREKYNSQCLSKGYPEDCLLGNIYVSTKGNEKYFDCHVVGNTRISGRITVETDEIAYVRVSVYPISSNPNAPDIYECLAVMTIVFNVLAPDLSQIERREIVEKLGVFDSTHNYNYDGLELYTTYQNIGYASKSSKVDGLNFMFKALGKN